MRSWSNLERSADGAGAGPAPAVRPRAAELQGLRHSRRRWTLFRRPPSGPGDRDPAAPQRHGASRRLGGSLFRRCRCSAASHSSARRSRGTVVHLNDVHGLVIRRPRPAGIPARIAAVAAVMDGAGFDARRATRSSSRCGRSGSCSPRSPAGTCLMRAPVGAIVAAPGGRELMLGLQRGGDRGRKSRGTRAASPAVERTRAMLTTPKSPFSASDAARPRRRQAAPKADHVIGDLVRRGEAAGLPCRS